MDSQFLNSEMSYNYATISSAQPKKRAGRTKFRETRHPVYKGVRRRGANGARWDCEVREPNKKSRIWLGTFPTAEMAARAHDVAAMALRGRKACLNFADSAWLLTVPESCSHDDIRKAAVAAAGMFMPQSLSDGADEEQSSVTLAAASTSQSAETSVAAPDAVDTSLFDLIEFDRDFHYECYFGMPIEAVTGYQYQWDDTNYECVADDVSLWSYSI